MPIEFPIRCSNSICPPRVASMQSISISFTQKLTSLTRMDMSNKVRPKPMTKKAFEQVAQALSEAGIASGASNDIHLAYVRRVAWALSGTNSKFDFSKFLDAPCTYNVVV